MRIALNVDPMSGGWKRGVELARALAATDANVTLAVTGAEPTEAQLAELRAIGSLKWMVTAGPALADDRSPAHIEAASGAIARFVNVIDVDAVVLDDPLLAAFGQFRVPTVAACDPGAVDWSAAAATEDSHRSEQQALLAQAYREATALFATTRALAERTASQFELAQAPAVVPPGGDAPHQAAAPHGVRDIVLAAIHPQDAAADLAVLNGIAGRSRAPIMAIGRVPEQPGASLDIGHIWSLGDVQDDERAGWLQAAPIFVSTSRRDEAGSTLLDAAHVGCALVLPDLPPVREVWEGAALLLPPRHEIGFARAIDHLVANPERCARLGELARERARTLTMAERAAALLAVCRGLDARMAAA